MVLYLLLSIFSFFPVVKNTNNSVLVTELPSTILAFNNSGLTHTRKYSYNGNKQITKIENLPAEGVRRLITNIRYNASGKPTQLITFYSGINNRAEGITTTSTLTYSGGDLVSMRNVSTADEVANISYTYYPSTHIWESVQSEGDLPPILLAFSDSYELLKMYTADGSVSYEAIYDHDSGIFYEADVPLELKLVFDVAPHYLLSDKEIISFGQYGRSSNKVINIRDDQGRINRVEFRSPENDELISWWEVKY